ncbi:group I intron-associated PD-(D/E)XK endonuclease [Halobaculum sp. EA56]|uniref:group I intron-associated PD-(D/E)XK endonuclease n=1 Tax=Halobaculum sp. EA56 TaxID=3421648 RepID=UPI003EBBB1BE
MRPIDELPSHRKGEYTESVVIAELQRRGVPVSRPVGDNERYDLVPQSDHEFRSAQVKTGPVMNGCVYVRGKSQHTNSQGHVYKTYDDEVDCFIVYCHDLQTMYLVPADVVGSAMHLRVEDPEQHDSSINWAEDYEFDARWPDIRPV